MPQRDEKRHSRSDSARTRAAISDLIPPIVLLILTQGSLIALDPHDHATVWKVVWSLSPLIPAVWLVEAHRRILRRADEYERMLQLEAIAIGFAVMILLGVTGGVLDAARIGSTRQSLQLVFTGGVVAWAAALAFKTSRAR